MNSQVTIVVLACLQAVPQPELFSSALEQGGLKARVIREPCSSKVEVFQMLRTLADEADLLWVVGCPPEACQLVEGSTRMAKRVGHAQEYLQEIGLEPERLGMVYLPFGSQDIISATVKEIQQRAQTLGINPARAGTVVTKEQA